MFSCFHLEWSRDASTISGGSSHHCESALLQKMKHMETRKRKAQENVKKHPAHSEQRRITPPKEAQNIQAQVTVILMPSVTDSLVRSITFC